MIANGVVPTRVMAPSSVASMCFWYMSIAINRVIVDRNTVWQSGADLAMSSTASNPVAPDNRITLPITVLVVSRAYLTREFVTQTSVAAGAVTGIRQRRYILDLPLADVIGQGSRTAHIWFVE
jgi:hypothetical protein